LQRQDREEKAYRNDLKKGDIMRKGFVVVGKKQLNKLIQDHNDMFNAYKTIFYRCGCGRLREQGIVCPNENCKENN
jgi:hypothetical protein